MTYLHHLLIIVITITATIECKKPKEKPAWAKKDVRDYSDADLERLYEQVSLNIYIQSLRIH